MDRHIRPRWRGAIPAIGGGLYGSIVRGDSGAPREGQLSTDCVLGLASMEDGTVTLRLCRVIACASALLAIGSEVLADRCIGPKDNSGAASSAGVPPISAEDITWCDDFDSYCDTNCGDLCNGAWPLHSEWPGYEPVPDNLCNAGGLDPGGGPNDASEYYFRRSFHWPRPGVTGGSFASSAPGPNPSRWEGWDGNPGWVTEPYTLEYQGGSNTNQYHTFSLMPAIERKFPGSNAINGTDENPLTLRFWLNPGTTVESPPNLPFYVELRLDTDHAPTDWIVSTDAVRNPAFQECIDENVAFPVVCQQRSSPGNTAAPLGCPPLSTEIHGSLAFGWLAQLDRNPCNLETGRKPTTYHAAVFDGRDWYQLNGGLFPGQVDKFNYDTLQAYFEMKVKSTTAEIMLIAPTHRPDKTGPLTLIQSTATVPRQYLGPFNRISFGAAPGCQLDPDTGECLDPNQNDVWRYMQGNAIRGWSKVFLDRMALLGGIGDTSTAACCLPDGSCEVLTSDECATAGGVFRGIGTTCDGSVCLGACCEPQGVCTDTTVAACSGNFQGIGTTCATPDICPCPIPFADFDMDGDVDMTDFAGLQRCLTIGGGSIADECECFDTEGDGDIDETDVEKFVLCGTGSEVGWVATPNCP